MQLENNVANDQKGAQGSGANTDNRGGRLDDSLRKQTFAEGQDLLTPREQTRRRMVQLAPNELVCDRIMPSAWVDVTSRPPAPEVTEQPATDGAPNEVEQEAPADDAAAHDPLQAEALTLAQDGLREATRQAATASPNGFPDATALDGAYDSELAKTSATRPEIAFARGGPVEWLVREEGPWSLIAANPTFRPNLHAVVHEMHVDLALSMQGNLRKVGSGGRPPDATLDLAGVAGMVELGLVAGVSPQVEEGRESGNLDHVRIKESLAARTTPTLQRFGYEFVPKSLSLLDGGKPYKAPEPDVVQEGLVAKGELAVIASADSSETAKESGGFNGKSGVFSRMVTHAMRQYPHLSIAECAVLVFHRSPDVLREYKQTPESFTLGGKLDVKAIEKALKAPAPRLEPEPEPEPEKASGGIFSKLFGSGEDDKQKEAKAEPPPDKNKRALVVGAWDFVVPDLTLPGSCNDAGNWESVLKGRGYAVDKVVDAGATDGEGLHTIIEGFFGSLAPGMEIVFQFSGHGSAPGDPDGEGLVGTDYVPPKKRGEFPAPKGRTIFRYATLYSLVGQARSKGIKVELVLDCCHSGQMVDKIEDGFDATRTATDKGAKSQRLMLYRNEAVALEKMLKAHHEGTLKASDQRQNGGRAIKRYNAALSDLETVQVQAYDSKQVVGDVAARVPSFIAEVNELLNVNYQPGIPAPSQSIAVWLELLAKLVSWTTMAYDKASGQNVGRVDAKAWT